MLKKKKKKRCDVKCILNGCVKLNKVKFFFGVKYIYIYIYFSTATPTHVTLFHITQIFSHK